MVCCVLMCTVDYYGLLFTNVYCKLLWTVECSLIQLIVDSGVQFCCLPLCTVDYRGLLFDT